MQGRGLLGPCVHQPEAGQNAHRWGGDGLAEAQQRPLQPVMRRQIRAVLRTICCCSCNAAAAAAAAGSGGSGGSSAGPPLQAIQLLLVQVLPREVEPRGGVLRGTFSGGTFSRCSARS